MAKKKKVSKEEEEIKPVTYPVWFYHHKRCKKGRIVRSHKEHKEMGSGWVDTPAKFPEEKPKKEGLLKRIFGKKKTKKESK